MGEEGLEPPTPRFVAACSNPLSYTPYQIEFDKKNTTINEPKLQDIYIIKILIKQ